MYCTIHLLEIIRLSDFSSPLFYPSLLGRDTRLRERGWVPEETDRHRWLAEVVCSSDVAIYELLGKRVGNCLLYIVRSSDMADDEQKWLDGRFKELGQGWLRSKNGYLHVVTQI